MLYGRKQLIKQDILSYLRNVNFGKQGLHSWEPLPFIKGGRLSFHNFPKKGEGGSDFSHKKGGVGKIEGCFKKGGDTLSLIFIVTKPSQSYLSLSEGWCFAYLPRVSQYSLCFMERTWFYCLRI